LVQLTNCCGAQELELQDKALGVNFESGLEGKTRKQEPTCQRAKLMARALSRTMADTSREKNIAGDKLDASCSSCAFPHQPKMCLILSNFLRYRCAQLFCGHRCKRPAMGELNRKILKTDVILKD
jgi:hypothetical protein